MPAPLTQNHGVQPLLSDKLFFWLFQNRPDLPALILEAQMAPDPGFLRRLYAETARLLQQQPTITAWRVLVITPSRHLDFGDPGPVAEFLERRLHWVELQPQRWPQQPAQPAIPLFQRLLALLVQPEAQIPTAVQGLRREAPLLPTPDEAADLLTLIPTILVARFYDRPVEEIAAMAGITARIKALPLGKLESLADALLDFQGPADLTAWLAANA